MRASQANNVEVGARYVACNDPFHLRAMEACHASFSLFTMTPQPMVGRSLELPDLEAARAEAIRGAGALACESITARGGS